MISTTGAITGARRWLALGLVWVAAVSCAGLSRRRPAAAPALPATATAAATAPAAPTAPAAAGTAAGLPVQPAAAALPFASWDPHDPRVRPGAYSTPEARERLMAELAARRQALEAGKLAASGARWLPLGPTPIVDAQGRTYSGRVDALAIDPLHAGTLYIGSPNGGAWRSRDGGGSWTSLTDGQCSQSIEALALDPVDPRIVYAGTGYGFSRNFQIPPCGLLKSFDQGDHWQRLPLPGTLAVGHISIDPTTAGPAGTETLLLSTDQGIFRSTDGGASFSLVLANAYTVVKLPMQNLARDPTRPAIVYAAVAPQSGANAQVYKSADGGQTWLGSTTGIPAGLYPIALAIAPSAPDTLYAVAGGGPVPGGGYGYLARFWRSRDGGASWTEIVTAGDVTNCQCFYDLTLAVDPVSPETVYFGGVGLFVSSDGAATWHEHNSPHPDYHALEFASARLYAGNDGGLFSSSDGGRTWTSHNNNQSLTQIYNLALSASDVRAVVAGTQDNGTLLASGSPVWKTVLPGDGGFSLFDPRRPATIYAQARGSQLPFIFRSDDGGKGFALKIDGLGAPFEAWRSPTPMALGPADPEPLFVGLERVYRSDDRGDSWHATSQPMLPITALAVDERSPPAVYVAGTFGNSGDSLVRASADGGKTWSDAKEPLKGTDAVITHLAIDRFDPRIAYLATAYSKSAGTVYRSGDFGATWQDVSGDLPAHLAASAIVLVEPSPTDRKLFVATEAGIFSSVDDGRHWLEVSDGLPAAVPIEDLAWSPSTRRLVAATYGRGAYALQQPCVATATALCLGGGRFTVTATWKTPQGQAGSAQAVPLTADTGFFWFFGPDNVELLVKVLDGCAFNGHHWVFAGGLTDVEVHLAVSDSFDSSVQQYVSLGGQPFQPIQDTVAFASCP